MSAASLKITKRKERLAFLEHK